MPIPPLPSHNLISNLLADPLQLIFFATCSSRHHGFTGRGNGAFAELIRARVEHLGGWEDGCAGDGASSGR